MRSFDLLVETEIAQTPRIMQLGGMFDVPAREKLSHRWQGQIPIDERPWNVGLIVGPSGAGKSSLSRELFGPPTALTWDASSVIDDFDAGLPIQTITDACSAVGFNTIPSWMKPFGVLSTGEKFRVELARALLEQSDPIVIDEFTSVIDRQVAHIGCHAVQKFVRSRNRQFVAVTCHYDVIEWLQPDWMLEPATMTFQWRAVQRRPSIDIEIARVHHQAWALFAPFHYLTAELHRAANCFVLFANGLPASFAGILHRPHASADNIKAISRLVTLPDFQGLGLAFILIETLGGMYRALGYRFRNYPAHPAFVRAHDRSPKWRLMKAPGKFSPALGRTSSLRTSHLHNREGKKWNVGGRPCAVFEYVGAPAEDVDGARRLIGG